MASSSEQKRDKPFYEIAKDANGRHHWVLWSGNGRQLCQNVVDYESPKDAIRAIEAVQATIKEAFTIVKASA